MGIKMNTCHTVLQQISISLHKEEYGVFFSYSDLCRLINGWNQCQMENKRNRIWRDSNVNLVYLDFSLKKTILSKLYFVSIIGDIFFLCWGFLITTCIYYTGANLNIVADNFCFLKTTLHAPSDDYLQRDNVPFRKAEIISNWILILVCCALISIYTII